MELSKLLLEVENEKTLDEQWYRRLLTSTFNRLFKIFGALTKNDIKIFDDILKNSRVITVVNKAGEEIRRTVKNGDELANLLKIGKIGLADKGKLAWDLLRNGEKISPELRKQLIDGWAMSSSTIKDFKNLNRAQMGYELKKVRGVTDDLTRKEMINAFITKYPDSVVAKEAKMWGKKIPPPVQSKKGLSGKQKAIVGAAGVAGTAGIGSLINNIQPKVGGISRGVLGALKLKWVWGLIKITSLVGVSYWAIKKIGKKYNEQTGSDIENEWKEASAYLPVCMFQLLHRDGAVLSSTATENGDPIVNLTKTGNEEYDNVGGIKLYIDHTITTADDKRKGTWECKLQSETLEEHQTLSNIFEDMLLTEELLIIERDARSGKMNKALNAAVDYMKSDIENRDLKTLHKRIKRLRNLEYEGRPALLSVMSKYNENTGNDLINDIQLNFKGLDFTQDSYRKEILSLLQSADAQSGNIVSGPIDDIISITWNDNVSDNTSDNVTNTTDDSSALQQTGKYTPCAEMPFKFGCKNPMIKGMQKCLGMEEKYQTGNFGPITYERLSTAKYDLSNGITNEIYMDVLKRCGKVYEKPLEKVDLIPPQPIKPITPQIVPQTDKLKPMNISNIEPKINPQINKLKSVEKPTTTQQKQTNMPLPVPDQEKQALQNNLDYNKQKTK